MFEFANWLAGFNVFHCGLGGGDLRPRLDLTGVKVAFPAVTLEANLFVVDAVELGKRL